MANLHVQPKRKNNTWIWIVILIVIIAAALYYFEVYKKQAPIVNDSVFQQPTSSQLQTAQLSLQPKVVAAIKSSNIF
jgi:flagellar basal body-associated protein FliL